MYEIVHYGKNEYYGHMVRKTEMYLRKNEGDSVIRYWHCVGMYLLGDMAKSMRGLVDMMRTAKDMRGSVIGTILDISKGQGVDEMSAEEMESELKDILLNVSGEKAMVHLALYYLLVNRSIEAKKIVDSVYRDYSDKYLSANDARGWIHLFAEKDILTFESDSIFKTDNNNGRLLFLMGKVQYLKRSKKIDEAISILSMVSVKYPNTYCAQMEKSHLYILMNKWEEANEIVTYVLNKKDPLNFEGLVINLLYMLTKENKMKIVTDKFKTLLKVVANNESSNHNLLYKLGKSFGAISGSNSFILKESEGFITSAINLLTSDTVSTTNNKNLAEYHAAKAHLLLLMSKFTDSEECFNKALDLDDSSISSNIGVILACLRQGKYSECRQMLESLNDIRDTLLNSSGSLLNGAHLFYLNYLLLFHGGSSFLTLPDTDNGEFGEVGEGGTALGQLFFALDLFSKQKERLKFSLDYYSLLDPQFLVDMCNDLLQHCPRQPLGEFEPVPITLTKLESALRMLVETMPGMIEGQYLLANCFFLKGQLDDALRMVSS